MIIKNSTSYLCGNVVAEHAYKNKNIYESF